MASSVLATMRSLGHTVSMTIITIIVSIYIGDKTLKDAEPQMLIIVMHTAFIVFTALALIGALCSMKKPKKKG